jgi:ribosomal protein L4
MTIRTYFNTRRLDDDRLGGNNRVTFMLRRLFIFTTALMLPVLSITNANADMVFVPNDKNGELHKIAKGLADNVKMKLALGTRDKLNIKKNERLFIVAHGHRHLPWFVSNKMKWTAKEMAKLLESRGLPKDHKDIYLLVCYGGLSVNEKKTAKKMLKIIDERKNADKKNNKTLVKKKEKEFKTLADTIKPAEYDKESQELPLAAQLAHELKSLPRPYKNFRIIAYDGAVSAVNIQSYSRVVLELEDGSKLVEKLKKKWTLDEEKAAIDGRIRDKKIYRSVWH